MRAEIDEGANRASAAALAARPPGRALARAGLLAVAALCIALWRVDASTVEDLRPRPDALEYEEAARNLVDGNGYALVIEGATYPPRYPPGFSLLLAPWLLARDGGPGSGIAVVFASALATVWATWKLADLAAGPVPAVVAAALLVLSPLFAQWSRAVMSDVPSAAATTWILVAAAASLRDGRTAGAWLALGAAAGLTSVLRATSVLVVVGLAAAAALSPARQRWPRLFGLAAGFVLGMLPLALYDAWRFGSPRISGYDVWAPGGYFDPRFVFAAPLGGGVEANFWVYGRDLIGSGPLYPWPIALLIGLGLVVSLRAGEPRRAVAVMTLAFVVPLVGVHLCFFWQDARYLLGALPPLLCVAASCLGSGARATRGLAAALVLLGVYLLVRTPETYALRRAPHEPSSLRAVDAVLPDDAAFVAFSTEPLVRRIVRRDTQRIWLPILMDEHQIGVRLRGIAPERRSANSDWVRQGLTPANLEATLRALLAAGRPIYVSTMLATSQPLVIEMLQTAGLRFRLEPVATGDPQAALYRVLDLPAAP